MAKIFRSLRNTSTVVGWSCHSRPTQRCNLTSTLNLQNVDSQKSDYGGPPARPYEDIPIVSRFQDLKLNWQFTRNPKILVDYLEKQSKKYGKIFRPSGWPHFLFVFDPKDIEMAYRAGDKGYPMRFPITEWSGARDELKLPYGMFLEEDEKWLKQRVPISKYIMMPRKMADYHLPFNEVSQDFIRYVRKNREEGNVLSDTVSALNKWSFESVSVFVLGKRMGCLEEEMPQDCKDFVKNVQGFLSTTTKLVMGIPLHKFIRTQSWKNLIKYSEVINSIAVSLIKSRIEEIENHAQTGEDDGRDDFLSHMIHSGKMSIEEIAVNAVDLLVAGVDTVRGNLYCLATNPQVQGKLRKEVQEVVGDVSVVEPAHVQNMPYLRDCVKESQRLYPIVVHNTRILKEEVVLSGYKVPAGVPLMLSNAVSGRLSEHYPEPEKFIPERWSRENEELPNPFMSLPFGFGRRMCVGRRVAELELHILLAQLIKTFDFKYADDQPLKYIFNWFYRPEREMNLIFKDL